MVPLPRADLSSRLFSLSICSNEMSVSCGNTKKASMLLVRKLYTLMQNLGPLPDNVCLNMKLVYYDDGNTHTSNDSTDILPLLYHLFFCICFLPVCLSCSHSSGLSATRLQGGWWEQLGVWERAGQTHYGWGDDSIPHSEAGHGHRETETGAGKCQGVFVKSRLPHVKHSLCSSEGLSSFTSCL